MSYVAAVCGKGQEVNKVKEQLLQSNPVLEGESQVMFTAWMSVNGFTELFQNMAKLRCGQTLPTIQELRNPENIANVKLR